EGLLVVVDRSGRVGAVAGGFELLLVHVADREIVIGVRVVGGRRLLRGGVWLCGRAGFLHWRGVGSRGIGGCGWRLRGRRGNGTGGCLGRGGTCNGNGCGG